MTIDVRSVSMISSGVGGGNVRHVFMSSRLRYVRYATTWLTSLVSTYETVKSVLYFRAEPPATFLVDQPVQVVEIVE